MSGKAELSVSGSAEQSPATSKAEVTASSVTESQDSVAIEYISDNSSHSPEIVPSRFRGTRTRSGSNPMKLASSSGSAQASKAGGSSGQSSSSGVTMSQSARTTKRTHLPRKSVDPKRIKLKDDEPLTKLQRVPPSFRSKKAEDEDKDVKDKVPKASSAQGASQESEKPDEQKVQGQKVEEQAAGQSPEPLPQDKTTIIGGEPVNTAQLSGADDAGDSIVLTSSISSASGSEDGDQSSSSSAVSANNDPQGETGQDLTSVMPPPSAPAPSNLVAAPEAGSRAESIVVRVIRGDLHPPLIRPQGAPSYWNHQREHNPEAEGRVNPGGPGRSIRLRSGASQPNRFNRPDQRGQRGHRRDFNRGRFNRRSFF